MLHYKKQHLAPAGLENTLFIDPEINQQGNFAIRLVTNEAMKEVASELSIEALQSHKI